MADARKLPRLFLHGVSSCHLSVILPGPFCMHRTLERQLNQMCLGNKPCNDTLTVNLAFPTNWKYIPRSPTYKRSHFHGVARPYIKSASIAYQSV